MTPLRRYNWLALALLVLALAANYWAMHIHA
jgi:hypothetical protein